MGKDHHTSKSKLKLKDGVMKKPGRTPTEPDIGKACTGDSKKCVSKQKSFFQQVMGGNSKPMGPFGPKQAQVLRQFRTSMLVYGTATVLLTIWMCEWRAVLQYLPYYNGKYKTDD